MSTGQRISPNNRNLSEIWGFKDSGFRYAPPPEERDRERKLAALSRDPAVLLRSPEVAYGLLVPRGGAGAGVDRAEFVALAGQSLLPLCDASFFRRAPRGPRPRRRVPPLGTSRTRSSTPC